MVRTGYDYISGGISIVANLRRTLRRTLRLALRFTRRTLRRTLRPTRLTLRFTRRTLRPARRTLRRTLRPTRLTLRLAFLLALRFLAFLLTAIVRPFSADELSQSTMFSGSSP